MKRNFFDTSFASLSGTNGQIPRVLKYVVENRDTILSEDELTALAQSIRTILKNPMAELFNRIVSSGQLENFAAIYSKTPGKDLPEVTASQNITFDLKQVDDQGILTHIPEANKKVLINITPMVRAEKFDDNMRVIAADVFQHTICRSFLVASYYDNTTWLNPYLNVFITKTYSIVISSIISRAYNLTLTENALVSGILALFMCQMLDGDKIDYYPALLNRCTWLGSRKEIEDLAEACREKSSGGLNLELVCDLIAKLGPEKMRNFNVSALKMLCAKIGPDVLTSYIALEYPPYWIYLLISALSGTKIPLIYLLNNTRLMQEGRSKFLDQLLTDERLFQLQRG